MEFKGRDILSTKDLCREEIEYLFDTAKEVEHIINCSEKNDLLEGKVLATLFFQPSTRTRLSFETAMLRLGGGVTGFGSPEMTRAGSAARESLQDTARVISAYADVAVIRHFMEGAPAIFAEYSDIPVINGGDGQNEHPTQALADMYTIVKEKGRIDGLEVLFLGKGDARTFHSTSFGLSKFDDVQAYFLTPPGPLELPKWVENDLSKLSLNYTKINNIEEVINEIDVIYMEVSRRYTDIPRKNEGKFHLDLHKLRKGKKDLIVLHPLPRLNELPMEIDNTRYAKYFDQIKNSITIRMALLALILGRTP